MAFFTPVMQIVPYLMRSTTPPRLMSVLMRRPLSVPMKRMLDAVTSVTPLLVGLPIERPCPARNVELVTVMFETGPPPPPSIAMLSSPA